MIRLKVFLRIKMINLDYKSHQNKEFEIENSYYDSLKSSLFEKEKKVNQKQAYENIEARFERYMQKDDSFKKVFRDENLENIILIKNEDIEYFIERIERRIKTLTETKKKEFYIKVKRLFRYSDKFQSSVLTPFFTDNFNFTICFYCNKDFVTNFQKENKELVSTFQLDHFYDKGTYPYLGLSLYNLIPSCPTCNSGKVKGTANCYKQCLSPNHKDFDFNKKVKFKLLLSDDCKNLHIKSKDDIEIPLKENYSNEYEKYIKVFHLDNRYQAHKDIVFEMMKNAELYPESRLRELQELTGIPYQQIKKDIFNLIDDDMDLSKKPFSKLIKDISEELNLI